MGAFVMAWLVGEGIIIYRTARDGKKETGHYTPPGPGQLVWSSGIFVLLALLAESQQARTLAITMAWGFDIAAFMNLYGVGSASIIPNWPPGKLPDNLTFPGQTEAAVGALPTPRGYGGALT